MSNESAPLPETLPSQASTSPDNSPSATIPTRAVVQKPWVRHTILSTTLLLGAIAAGNLLNFQAERIANRWVNGLKYADAPGSANVDDKANLKVYLESFRTSSPAERDRIQVQLEQIERRARAYARITVFFYTRLFAAIALASTTGIISAVCLFYISKMGWKDANGYVVNIFVVSSVITVLVGSFPVIFRQENNVQTNAKLYMSYLDLENQILTALATQKNEQGQPIDLHTIMVGTDQKMAELNIESIGFDANAIPRQQDIFRQLEPGN